MNGNRSQNDHMVKPVAQDSKWQDWTKSQWKKKYIVLITKLLLRVSNNGRNWIGTYQHITFMEARRSSLEKNNTKNYNLKKWVACIQAHTCWKGKGEAALTSRTQCKWFAPVELRQTALNSITVCLAAEVWTMRKNHVKRKPTLDLWFF